MSELARPDNHDVTQVEQKCKMTLGKSLKFLGITAPADQCLPENSTDHNAQKTCSLRRRAGTVVRALASHQCGPGLIPMRLHTSLEFVARKCKMTLGILSLYLLVRWMSQSGLVTPLLALAGQSENLKG